MASSRLEEKPTGLHTPESGSARSSTSANFDKIAASAVKETDALIDATAGKSSSLDLMRARYATRMSGNFAFLRSIPEMKAALPEIEKDLKAFTDKNKWATTDEIPSLFKNLDVIRMSRAIATAILYTAERFGSRGSGFVLDGGNFMDRIPRPEDESGRERIVTVKKDGEDLKIDVVPVRPIPAERDLWFEKVWGAYRKRTQGK